MEIRSVTAVTICQPKIKISHDSSVGEGIYLTAWPLHGRSAIPGHDGVFQGIFSWLITL